MAGKPQPKIKGHSIRYPKWSEDADRLILYADFMGFTSRVLSNSHKDIKEELMLFRSKWSSKIEPLKSGDHLQFVQFSDSILIVANGTDFKMFNLLTKAAISLVHASMSMRIPIKGVIAQGVFSYDRVNELYFGKPLIDAYLLHEQLKYYGIVVHHTAEKTVKKFQDMDNPYYNSPIFLDKGITSHYHLCWNLINVHLHSEDITNQCKTWIETIAENVSGTPRMYIDKTLEVLKRDQRLSKTEDDSDKS